MPHIHNEVGQYDQTASAFIVRTDGSLPKLLLHKHKLLGHYLQFGGHIELEENLWEALEHEIIDESGYELSQLKILQPKDTIKELTEVTLHPTPLNIISHAFSNTHNHTDIEYAFTTFSEPNRKVKSGESNSIRAFSKKELELLSAKDIPENVREIGIFILDVCIKKWDEISTDLFKL